MATLAGVRVLIAVAIALALAPAAQARTLRVDDRSLAAGEVVRVSGTGWGTTIGICAADPIDVSLVRHRAVWRWPRIAGLGVTPIFGSFSVELRMPRGIGTGAARIVATQREHELRGLGGCADRPLATESRAVVFFHQPDNRCVEPACTPYEPVPRMGFTNPGTPGHPAGAYTVELPDGARLAVPAPLCSPRGCDDDEPPVEGPWSEPGAAVELFGDQWEIPEGCPDRVAISLLDASGTGRRLGTFEVDVEGRWRGRVTLPDRGLARGVATIYAATDSSQPRCALVAWQRLTILGRRRAAFMLGDASALQPSALIRIVGLGWGTDRCEALARVYLLGLDVEARHLLDVGARTRGSLDFSVVLPPKLPEAAAIVIEQRSRTEVAGRKGVGGRCRGKGTVRRAKMKPLALPGPGDASSPSPSGSPAAPPPPGSQPAPAPQQPPAQPQPEIDALVVDSNTLRVIGAKWGPPTCNDKPNPVSIMVRSQNHWEPLSTAIPEGGSFDVTFAPEPKVSPGALIRARAEPVRGPRAAAGSHDERPRSLTL